MIVEDTLEETVQKIKLIKPEERKIIIYTGVHPYEGTTEIAAQHEDSWKEHGALVVAHPNDSTPQAIWERQKEICKDGIFRPLDYSVSIDQKRYENVFSCGEPTVFIRFHGTPISKSKTSEKERTLWILTSTELMGYNFPQVFAELNHDVCLNTDPILTRTGIHFIPADRILLEYFYKGDEVTTDDPFIKTALIKDKEKHPKKFIPKIFHIDDFNWSAKRNLRPSYLVQRKLNQEDIDFFNDNHLPAMDWLLEYISDNINHNP